MSKPFYEAIESTTKRERRQIEHNKRRRGKGKIIVEKWWVTNETLVLALVDSE